MMRQVSPSEWGARVDYDSWADTSKDKWIIHYNGPAANVADSLEAERAFLREIERFHIEHNGWRGIAYNYAIGPSGTLYRLRGESAGGHTRGDYEPDDVLENWGGRAVFFMIGGNEKPTQESLDTFAQFWAEDPMPVIGHMEVFEHGEGGTSTRCPGPYLMDYINNREYEKKMALKDEGQRSGVDDVFVDDWKFGKSMGWVNENTDPDDVVTKEEMVTFLRRAYVDAVAAAAGGGGVDGTARAQAQRANDRISAMVKAAG